MDNINLDVQQGMKALFLWTNVAFQHNAIPWMSEHPFGLQMPTRTIELVPVSDTNMKEICTLLVYYLGTYRPLALLRLEGEGGSGNPNLPAVHFQMTTTSHMFLTMNDKNVEGDHHVSQMDQIFTFIASCNRITIQSQVIPKSQYLKGLTVMRQTEAEFRKHRSRAS